MPSINYPELMNAVIANEVDANTFIRLGYGSISERKKDLVYFSIEWNARFADKTAKPEYVKIWDCHTDDKNQIHYSSVTETKFKNRDEFGKEKDTWYFAKRITKKGDPNFFRVAEFMDEANIAALKELKNKIEKENSDTRSMNKETKLVYKILSDNLDEVYKGYVIRTKCDKNTGKDIVLEDPYVSINFDFTTWHAKLQRIGGKQISRVAFLKTEEELAASVSKDILYKSRKIDGAHNRPQDVYKYSSGTFWGDINFPGKMYTNSGDIKVSATFGFIFVTPDVKSSSAKSGSFVDPESKCDSYEDDGTSSKLAAAAKSLNKEKKKDKKKDEKKDVSSSEESESSSSEEEVEKSKKKSGKKDKKKKSKELSESEESESDYDSE